jgi:predicted kinase
MSRVVLVTGLQAAGKTTVARLVAERLPPPAAHFDGDVLDGMVVNGHAPMTADPSPEALRELALRYAASARLAAFYAANGVAFVCSDIVLGADVATWVADVNAAAPGVPVDVVVLDPPVEAIVAREAGRGGTSYRDWRVAGGSLADAVTRLREALLATPRDGLWLDTGDEPPEVTAGRVVAASGG